MKEITTLKKISELLNVSISTVSRALKDHPEISEKTKERVRELAAKLEYVPDANAIQLRTNNSRIFGLLVPSVSYYFYDSFIAAVEEECTKNGYSLLILQSGDDPLTEINHLKLCRQNRITGLFVCITPQTKDITPFLKLNDSGTPVIFFDKVPSFEACNKVCAADADAARISAQAILNKKKKKVLALFGNHHLSITRKRLPAFIEAFEKEKQKPKLVIDHALDAEEARKKTIENLLLKNKPDTIFCMSDEILSGTMKAIQQLGMKVPVDISVIAISNGFIPKLYYPEITYAETSGYKMGKLAYTRMMSCLAGSTFIQLLSVESVLVEGGSL
jgi:LacI family transcriptional regulator, galactose operon repressor